MLVIPLGLRAKLYIKPWASIAIAFFTLGFTFDALIGQKDLENFKKWNLENHHVYDKAYQALTEGCPVRLAESAADCEFIVQKIKASDMASPEQILPWIDQNEKYDAISKQKIRDFVESFIVKMKGESSAQDLKSLADYKAAVSKSRADVETYHEDHFLLTRDNMNWKSFTLAQWTHSNWWTLLANLLIVVLFSLYLEQRVGSVFLFLIYMFGGYVGMFLQAPFLAADEIAAGSTPNAMALIGAYGFFFYKEKFAIGKFLIPVWVYALLFAVLGNAFCFEGDIAKNVPLLANVAGLFAGVMCGLIVSWMVWVQNNFLFPKEQLAYFRAKKSTQTVRKISYMLEILDVNPYNYFAADYLFRSIAKYKLEPSMIQQETLAKVCQTLVRLVNGEFKVNHNEVYALLSLVPMSWNFTNLPMPKLGKKEIQNIEVRILQSDWRLGLRLYDAYLAQNPESSKVDSIMQTVKKVIVHAESPLNQQLHQNIEWLRIFVIFNSKTILGQMLSEKYEDKTAAS